MMDTFSLGDSIRIVHGHHPAFEDDPSESLGSRERYDNNGEKDPEKAQLGPNTASGDVALHTGDTIRLIYTSGSGGGEILYEYTVV
jgi:hypothetical protein